MKKANDILSIILKLTCVISLIYFVYYFKEFSKNGRFSGEVGKAFDTRTGVGYLQTDMDSTQRIWGEPISN